MPSLYRLVGWGYAAFCAALVVGARSNSAPVRPGAPAPVRAPARVAELATDLTTDAVARRAAKTEMDELLK
jgi:hypothetical protein